MKGVLAFLFLLLSTSCKVSSQNKPPHSSKGFPLTRAARLRKKYYSPAYSTSASENDIEETFRNGVNVYVKKPDDFSLLK